MTLMNPEFATNGFQPDPSTFYRHSILDTISEASGFNYLHALVLGGPSRRSELEAFAQTPQFAIQAKQRTSSGRTALALAAHNSGLLDGCDRAVELLLPVSDPNDCTAYTPLMLSAGFVGTCSTVATFQMLLPVSDATLVGTMGWTALFIMCKYCPEEAYDDVFKLLLQKSDPNATILLGTLPASALTLTLLNRASKVSDRRVYWLLPLTRFAADVASQLYLKCAVKNPQCTDYIIQSLLQKTVEPLSDQEAFDVVNALPSI